MDLACPSVRPSVRFARDRNSKIKRCGKTEIGEHVPQQQSCNVLYSFQFKISAVRVASSRRPHNMSALCRRAACVKRTQSRLTSEMSCSASSARSVNEALT